MHDAPPRWTDGARALAQYLVDQGLTMYAFCERHNLDYAKVHRSLSGERGQRATIDFADDIDRATNGTIPAVLWRTETLSRKKPVTTPKETVASAAGEG